jgi:hypothetical protein
MASGAAQMLLPNGKVFTPWAKESAQGHRRVAHGFGDT